jgi:amino acid transporter
MNMKDIAESVGRNGLVTADAMAKAFSSETMAKVLIIGGICGIVTSWNSFLMGGSRALFSMAEVHMLPSAFGKLHPHGYGKCKIPHSQKSGGAWSFRPFYRRPSHGGI